MTKLVTLVNMSNWKGEDVSVHIDGSDDPPTVLEPIGQMGIPVYQLEPDDELVIRVKNMTQGRPEPFRAADGKQQYPKMVLSIE